MATRSLAERASTSGSLDKAFASVRKGSNPRSRGPDGVTLEEFGRNWFAHKKQLRAEISNGSYVFGSYLGHAIAKKGDRDPNDLKSYRPISVANIRDRVVQRAVLDKIWIDIRDFVCTQSSYGGVRRYAIRGKPKTDAEDDDKRCIKSAAKRIRNLYEEGREWVFETDIVNFYPSIDRDRLMTKLQACLHDSTLDGIIKRFLETSIVNTKAMGHKAALWDSLWGVPQGGVLSPAMANFYLFEFDRAIERAGFQMVRYVDDLVILCSSRDEAEKAYELCSRLLADSNLNIHPIEERQKTRIASPNEYFDFLGLRFARQSIRPVQKKMAKVHDSIKEITDPTRLKQTLASVIQEINWLLSGFAHAYDFCNLTKPDLRGIDKTVGMEVRRWLTRRGLLRRENQISESAFRHLGIRPMDSYRIDPLIRFRRPQKENGLATLARTNLNAASI